MKIVLDTSVLISALLQPTGTPAKIIDRWRAGDLVVVISNDLLVEFRRVLNYQKFVKRGISTFERTRVLLSDLAEICLTIDLPSSGTMVASDPADDKFLALAIEAQVDFVVSGDKHLLTLEACEGIRILTPAEFLTLLDDI